jgi:hypothetical protein
MQKFCASEITVAQEKGMEKQTGNLNRRLIKSCFGILIAILLGLATSLITPTGSAFASARILSAAPLAPSPLPTAADACLDKTKRYNDCGNGTVTDTVTGLIWLKQSDCFPAAAWDDAKKMAAGLKNGDCGLADGSSAGEWRLPTIAEWEATMKNAKDLKCTGPVLTNDAGTACIAAGPSSFAGVEADYFWSSTAEGNTVSFGDLDHGNLLHGNSIDSLRVWPVRGGQR